MLRTSAGMTTAQVDWVAIHNAPTITWHFRERPDAPSRCPIGREMIKAGALSPDKDLETFATGNILWRDPRLDDGCRAHPASAQARICCCFTCSTSIQRTIGTVRGRPPAMTPMAHLDSQVGVIPQNT